MQLAGGRADATERHGRWAEARPGPTGSWDGSRAGAGAGGTQLLPGAAPEAPLPGTLKVTSTGRLGTGGGIKQERREGWEGGGRGGGVQASGPAPRPDRQHAPRSGFFLPASRHGRPSSARSAHWGVGSAPHQRAR